jgi:hypothetical protein
MLTIERHVPAKRGKLDPGHEPHPHVRAWVKPDLARAIVFFDPVDRSTTSLLWPRCVGRSGTKIAGATKLEATAAFVDGRPDRLTSGCHCIAQVGTRLHRRRPPRPVPTLISGKSSATPVALRTFAWLRLTSRRDQVVRGPRAAQANTARGQQTLLRAVARSACGPPPGPTSRPPRAAAPVAPRPRTPATSELTKRAKSLSRSSFQPPASFNGGCDRPVASPRTPDDVSRLLDPDPPEAHRCATRS